MKVIVIGGVAAGTKVAAKLKREDRSAEVTILTKSTDISYAGCGLPYYVGGAIGTREELVVNTPQKFTGLTGAEVKVGTEVIALDRAAKTVTAKDAAGEETVYSYDKLVIATGASPFIPPVNGVNLKNVFVMRTPDDAVQLRAAVESGEIKRAVVVGGGFIGLEVAENLQAQGVGVSVIDMAETILPNFLDAEMARYCENIMAETGINVKTSTPLVEIVGTDKVEKVMIGKRGLKSDACVLAIGIRPNTAFLNDSGIEMFKGTILTDEHLLTNDPDIYAVGDCAMVKNRETGKPAWSPMGSTANIAGRVAAMNIAGEDKTYAGVLGTGVAKLAGISVGRTGLTEAAAKAEGFDVITATCVVDDKAHYMPGAATFIIKMVADKTTRKLLGVQVLGKGAVDKVVDVAVVGISLGATVDQLANLDFAYAPPFSTAIHPFAHALNVLMNKMDGVIDSFTPAEFEAGAAEGYRKIDVSLAEGTVPGAPYVDLTAINGPVDGLGKDEKLLLICNKGKRAYLVQNRLKYYGYTNTKVLEAGITFNTSLLEEEE